MYYFRILKGRIKTYLPREKNDETKKQKHIAENEKISKMKYKRVPSVFGIMGNFWASENRT